ncbi:hypothetical protein RAL08_004551 [Vibrio parahaemolyticus]|uniref:hypothetical protein n=1 Tax=Vibrio diabolicus TaxID=50719 RepID=UPI00193D501D|nr:hypothetical protein [Vibrio parahaemolyticus]ELA7195965.1 hypothetical protein [Vibrio parahaemolyticus]MBE5196289.1 hypothetical protein [Vibrio parahaemolyticus]MBM5032261.1 hypothetical protein [Vibrio parahaemolyticus]
MAKNFSSSPKKHNFLQSLPQDCIADSDINSRCKFNFSYLDINQAGQNFIDWNTTSGSSKLVKLMDKLKEYTRQPLSFWKNEKIGKGKQGGKGKRQHCLEIYGDFPKRSAFKHPPHVPEDVLWGRFRLDNDTRLAGFILPEDKESNKNDINTFYVVFLDENHQFYQM